VPRPNVAAHLRHAGKATIEFDRVESPAVAVGEGHRSLEYGGLRVAFEEAVAEQIVARLFRRRPPQMCTRRCSGIPAARAFARLVIRIAAPIFTVGFATISLV